MPRLDDVLARHPRRASIIEMKGGQPELAHAVGESIEKANAVDRTCVGSFHQSSIDAIRAEFPGRDDQRLAGGGALDAASIVGAMAVDEAAAVGRIPGA